ncbi:sigma-54 interaction domain-containing protein [Aneurinibacillus terranovensis]|uniref:sigma-54 interaction domain-containing protein n=1 Tax=Aneurinibacillus terranovensis TaxID=278991 RepID=UPI0003F94DDC|nr:sigma 54-interacting transcriptional regulator [Aneurinibacillus terranovensis]
MSDITAQWSDHLEWLLGMINIGVHIVGKDGTTVFYNNKMAEIDGLERESVEGKSVFHLFPSLTDESSTLIRVLHTGEQIIDKMQTYVNLTGKQITSINSTYPLKKNGDIVGAVELAEDITRIVQLNDQVLDLRQQLFRSSRKTKKTNDTQYHFSDLIGESQLFVQALTIAKKASRTSSPVLISGPTGTGKELIAQSIHNAGIRHDKPFIAQNCAAVPRDLMEGLLFGTTKGAFTGAIDRPGIFEQANGGTLFLDEINSLDLQLQAKLLRVLQDGKIRRIGGMAEQNVNVRILAAMNIPAREAIDKGIIRTDLYYRLNVVNIELPPLLKRGEDIPLLVKHFIDKFNQTFGMNVTGVSEPAMRQLLSYSWPGNIRELRHAIESAFNMLDSGEAQIEVHHLPLFPGETSLIHRESAIPVAPVLSAAASRASCTTPINLPAVIDKIERDMIADALKECGGNISRAAEFLNLKRQSLQYKLKKYNL